jgi:DNA ligase-1
MREFAQLYAELDETTATNRKLEALQNYFEHTAPENAAWAVYFLAGGKPRQAVPTKLLREAAIEYAGLDEWLFEESHAAVGDTAETIAHILPPPKRHSDIGLAVWMEERIGPLRGADPGTIREKLFAYWDELTWRERFLFVKLIGGGFRVGVSKLLVTRALAAIAAVDAKLIAQRLMGWTDGRVRPTAAGFLQLIAAQSEDEHKLRGGQPYPFFLAHQLQGEPGRAGRLSRLAGRVEVRRHPRPAGAARRPELPVVARRGPDHRALSGAGALEPAGRDGGRRRGADLDRRRFAGAVRRPAEAHRPQDPERKLLAELPAVLLAYDLLELDGVDLRALPQHERRALLETLVTGVAKPQLRISPLVTADTWDDLGKLRAESRARGVEGMMLKARNAQYGVGRTKDVGTWWKWKIDPYAVDAVLIYAQPGSGRRASLYTDYTFAVWDGEGESAGWCPSRKPIRA